MKRMAGYWCVCIIITASLIGCTHVGKQPSYEPDMFSTVITELETRLMQSPDASENWQTHMQLARLYMGHQNPALDYGKALVHLERYFETRPTAEDDPELRDWLAALQNLVRLEQSRSELSKGNQELAKQNQELMTQNQELGKTINILKTLDQGVEEKRKGYRDQ